MTYLWLALASIVGWFVSTLAGGGSSFILMPVIGLFLGALAIPPIITTGGMIGNAERAFTYRQKINWTVIFWELPGAIVGACLGAFMLTQISVEWLSFLVGLFLVISGINLIIKNQDQSFTVRAWYFLPAGFIYSFLSGIIGSMGPILAPFYLNFGLEKEELLGTQAVNRMVIHIIKVIVYAIFGTLTLPLFGYGILIGIAAFPGNWLGNLVLEKISPQLFRQLVIIFVLFSGVFILWEQRNILILW
ncbi:MAG: sulfite exporter TauE/SafE family protein [Okeania sp. SIO2G4]|uniref:sulfite exporter TauE/SafE family protein n=1 Tax=unclassified Okeania TaxID=2634635 RepID=UPI0013BAD919|nr:MULTISPECIES: sulfite exporter TauE/SafE family protein [unclassified Okeania]NEP06104.1 sulfite exporter TauE/SafE family protein [Okeania sp. SIO4D6]NEP74383.1 sulfite exporter TauE/SafE family protein [Okeania sp. SIO2G5]NEP95422.1 sulfite exporter TauE/SafE family protein [Okeania sp. SIO2F5]NEQ93152.1 sulfite exporter TauE/SafE family protein [Okeania sp. SIO2G4]